MISTANVSLTLLLVLLVTGNAADHSEADHPLNLERLEVAVVLVEFGFFDCAEQSFCDRVMVAENLTPAPAPPDRRFIMVRVNTDRPQPAFSYDRLEKNCQVTLEVVRNKSCDRALDSYPKTHVDVATDEGPLSFQCRESLPFGALKSSIGIDVPTHTVLPCYSLKGVTTRGE